MGRSPCCDKAGVKRGPWTPEEDRKLSEYIAQNGRGSWRSLPKKAGLQRCGKSCRLRWTNYLRPDIIRGEFSEAEERTIIQLHALLGNRWSTIAAHLPRRTDNEIKNRWHTHIKKKLIQLGLDPATHKPHHSSASSAIPPPPATLSHSDHRHISHLHMLQWESVRLEAEARLLQQAKLSHSQPPPLICSSSSSSSSSVTTRCYTLPSSSSPSFSTEAFDHQSLSLSTDHGNQSPPYMISLQQQPLSDLDQPRWCRQEDGGEEGVIAGGASDLLQKIDEEETAATISEDEGVSTTTTSTEYPEGRKLRLRDEELLQELEELIVSQSPARFGEAVSSSAIISDDWSLDQFDLSLLL